MDYNTHIIVGRVGADPYEMTLQSGEKQVRINVATNATYLNKSKEKVEETDWHNVILYKKLADFATSYVKKGSKVLVEGRHKMRRVKNDKGEYITYSDIIAYKLISLDSQKRENEDNEQIPF
jgi:single-strand DNA-binding protein